MYTRALAAVAEELGLRLMKKQLLIPSELVSAVHREPSGLCR